MTNLQPMPQAVKDDAAQEHDIYMIPWQASFMHADRWPEVKPERVEP